MVFHKPYGFLIKNFKLIHLILTGVYIYLLTKVNTLYQYYNDFALGNASKLDAIDYVNNDYLIAIVVSIVICCIIYALMRYKKKPRLLYLALIGFYLFVVLLVQISYDGLQTIYISILDTKTLRLYRDLLRILVWLQYIPIVLVLIRGLGFDIKKFNFVKDLQELNIDVSDDEEVELTLGGTEVAQRKVHRGFRELKYYYLENRMFIHVILIVLLVISLGTFVVDKKVVNKEYQEGERFSSNDFSFQVLNTYITTRDYEGTTIGDLKHSFVVVKMLLQANHSNKELNTANLILKVGSANYVSEVRYAERFLDIGIVYNRHEITGSATYLFLFPVLKEDLNKEMQLVYAEDKVVNLSPVSLDEEKKEQKYSLGSKIDFGNSSMSSGYLQIQSYEINEKFSYSYQYEVMGEVFNSELSITSTSNMILHLVIDSSYPRKFTNYDIFSKYADLKYKVGEQEYTSVVLNDKTPGSYQEGLYLAVDKKISEASSIWFEIQIRNQKYLYTLK